MGLGKIGFEQQSLPQTGDGLVQPAQFIEREPQVAVRLRIVGLEFQGSLPASHRLVQLALSTKDYAQAVQGLGIGRLHAQDFTDVREGQVVPADLVGENAEAVQRIGVSWIGLQDLPIDLFGLLQMARVVVLQGQGVRLGNGGHRVLPSCPAQGIDKNNFPISPFSVRRILRTLNGEIGIKAGRIVPLSITAATPGSCQD